MRKKELREGRKKEVIELQQIEEILGRPFSLHEKNFLLLARKVAIIKMSYAESLTLEQQRAWLNKKNSRPRKKAN